MHMLHALPPARANEQRETAQPPARRDRRMATGDVRHINGHEPMYLSGSTDQARSSSSCECLNLSLSL